VATHSWEIAKFLSESERDSQAVRDFVETRPADVVDDHRHVVAVLYEADQSDDQFRRELGSARDQATHYSGLDHKLIRAALLLLRDLEAEILLGGRWGDFRAEFASTLDAQLFFAVDDEGTAPFERCSRRLNDLSQRLVRFCRVAIDHYLERHKGRLHVAAGPDAQTAGRTCVPRAACLHR